MSDVLLEHPACITDGVGSNPNSPFDFQQKIVLRRHRSVLCLYVLQGSGWCPVCTAKRDAAVPEELKEKFQAELQDVETEEPEDFSQMGLQTGPLLVKPLNKLQGKITWCVHLNTLP